MAKKRIPRRLARITNSEDGLLAALQNLSEYELTNSVLIPLLKELNHSRVEYFGGPTEQGKDIICWREDELGEVELCVAQVKKFKPTLAAGSSTSFSEVVTQISQCFEKKLPHISSQEYLPSQVYFITPFVIDTKTLQSRLEGYQALKTKRLRIIDGAKLVSLLQARLPELVSSLVDVTSSFHDSVISQLNNNELMAALNRESGPELKSFYTDLDMSVGKPTTHLFLSSKFSSTIADLFVDNGKWEQLKNVSLHASKTLGLTLLVEDPSDIEKRGMFSKSTNLTRTPFKTELLHIRREISRILEKRLTLQTVGTNGVFGQITERLEHLDSLLEKEDSRHFDSIRGVNRDLIHLVSIAQNNNKKDDPESKTKTHSKLNDSSIFADVKSLADRVIAMFFSRKPNNNVHEDLVFYVIINGQSTAELIARHRAWIQKQVRRINDGKLSLSKLREFLVRCTEIMNAWSEILGNELIRQAVGIKEGTKYHQSEGKYRLRIPLSTLLETGLNFSLLGEAGGGKTTSLQMYGAQRLSASRKKEITLFVPLGQVVLQWIKHSTRETSGSSSNEVLALDKIIHRFFQASGVRISERDFTQALKAKNTVLLLDGVDEAFKKAPTLVESINQMSTRFPQSQFVVSARSSGPYLDKLPFFPISLMPFTAQQRKSFIGHWLGKGQRSKVKKIESHLSKHPRVAEVVSNPLLATVLCTLAENDIPLPDSEIRMYEERMRLLLGQYDIHKKISRITSHRHHLETLSRKIAYYLHSHGKREEEIDRIHEIAFTTFRSFISEKRCKVAVNELIDPCNILVPMSEEGRLGFGHLRFQEYLVACELESNRGINLRVLVGQPWWEGPFLLLAQKIESIDWFLIGLAVKGLVGRHRDFIDKLIAVRPTVEQPGLRELLNAHAALDLIDPNLAIAEELGDFVEEDSDIN